MVIQIRLFVLILLSFPSLMSAPNDKFTMEEISKHNLNQDCWMLIEKKVYDVSAYQKEHFSKHNFDYHKFCGTDASLAWVTKDRKQKPHNRKAQLLLQKYLIGQLK